jgi:hypothetical protein
LAFFAQTAASFCKNCDHNVGFWEKRQFFRRKLAKIAANCYHNTDPRWDWNPDSCCFLSRVSYYLIQACKNSHM